MIINRLLPQMLLLTALSVVLSIVCSVSYVSAGIHTGGTGQGPIMTPALPSTGNFVSPGGHTTGGAGAQYKVASTSSTGTLQQGGWKCFTAPTSTPTPQKYGFRNCKAAVKAWMCSNPNSLQCDAMAYQTCRPGW